MSRKFTRLQAELNAADLDRPYLARLLKRGSRSYVDQRMSGRAGWTLEEMYTLMDLLHWPYDRMHELFPKDGKEPAGRQSNTSRRPTGHAFALIDMTSEKEGGIHCPRCGEELGLIVTTHLVMTPKQ